MAARLGHRHELLRAVGLYDESLASMTTHHGMTTPTRESHRAVKERGCPWGTGRPNSDIERPFWSAPMVALHTMNHGAPSTLRLTVTSSAGAHGAS